MARISHLTFDSKGPRRGLLGWIAGKPERSPLRSSEDGSVPSPAQSQAEASVKASPGPPESSHARSSATSSAGLPATPPENTPASTSDDFPPLNVVRIGDTVQIGRSADEKVEWSNQDFAGLFLRWLTTEYPSSRNGWVAAIDIETEFFSRFQEATGCHYLECGALYQGLGKVTEKRERTYKDGTGKRCSLTEYKVRREAS
jgi:hypothetical protein